MEIELDHQTSHILVCEYVCVCVHVRVRERWFSFFNVGVCFDNTLQTRERERERGREAKQENKQDYLLKMARWREKAKENHVSLLFQRLPPHTSCF